MSAPRLRWFYRALSGRADEIVVDDPEAELLDRPDTMNVLHLPAAWATAARARVSLAHRALHHTLGTFDPDVTARVAAFPRPLLAADLYAVAEDIRVEAVADRCLPGLRREFAGARDAALSGRADLRAMGRVEAIGELLVRCSLRDSGDALPVELREVTAAIAGTTDRLRRPGATAHDSVDVAAALYALMNVDGELREFRLGPVAYRDVVGPRYRGLTGEDDVSARGITVLEPADESGDEDADGEQPLAEDNSSARATSRPAPDAASGAVEGEPVTGIVRMDANEDEALDADRLVAKAPNEFVYPEWDVVRQRYRPDWCLVRVGRARAAQTSAHHRLQRLAHLLPALVATIEQVRPAARDLVLRRPDGDDLDLDACIEAILDLRVGVEPSDRVHASLLERRREVAVAFAMDLSGSTAERVPADPARPGAADRIVDLERDAVGLLAEALDRVGDVYGVWGFSGAGRDGVTLSCAKDLDEPHSAAVLHRLGGLEPDHTTRMAPVIRHLTWRLQRFDASTRIMMIISDGRPFDVDYGQQYGERMILPYAIADTARALDEARAAGVRPYLITVDPAGNDYLGDMCDEREYHVIADARQLPAALGQLYIVARDAARIGRSR